MVRYSLGPSGPEKSVEILTRSSGLGKEDIMAILVVQLLLEQIGMKLILAGEIFLCRIIGCDLINPFFGFKNFFWSEQIFLG